MGVSNSVFFVPLQLYCITFSVEYIRMVAQYRLVPIEIGHKYTDEDWGQKIMSIGEFIERFLGEEVKEEVE